MPRQKRTRRFEPRYGVSQSTLNLEAGYLRREVEDKAVIAPADVQTQCSEANANCQNTWKSLCLVFGSMPDRDQRILQALLFRDLWLVLELYRMYMQQHVLPSTAPNPALRPDAPPRPLQFSQYLFDL